MIRVIICSYPGIFSDLLRLILCKDKNIQVVGVINSTRIISKEENSFKSIFDIIRNSGLRYAILQFCQTTFYLILRIIFFKQAGVQSWPIFKTKNINNKNSQEFIRRLYPDVIVLANFNQKISREIISIPKHVCINIHPSALPKFKGVDPVVEALADGSRELGVSIHKVDDNFDTGDILAQKCIAVQKNKSVFFHQFRLFELGAAVALKIISEPAAQQTQILKNSSGDYYSWPNSSKIKTLSEKRIKLITITDYFSALNIIKALCV